MPNHVANHLEIIGHPKHVQNVLDAVKTTDEEGNEIPFAYEAFWPMPEEIRHVTAPAQIITKKEYDKQEARRELTDEPFFRNNITKAMSKDYIERFGANNWYDWALNNWGTKWGAYSARLEDSTNPDKDGNIIQFIYFDTAWSCGATAIQKLSETFPHVKFRLTFGDEDCGFNVGILLYIGGCLEEEYIPEGGTDEAMQIYFDTHGGSEGWEHVDGEWQMIFDD